MTRQRRPIRVAGEPVASLLPAIVALHDSINVGDDGAAGTQDAVRAEVTAPLVRALLRVEAELLQRDARVWDELAKSRTPEVRRADALVLLIQRVIRTLRRVQAERSPAA